MIMAIVQIFFMLMIVAGLVIFVFAPNTGILVYLCATFCLVGIIGIAIASYIKFKVDLKKAKKAHEEAEKAKGESDNAEQTNESKKK